MNLLAFDTSTDQMSIAVQRTVAGKPSIWAFEGAGGSQASSRLIPQIQALLAQAELQIGQLQSIAYGAGPGSFTGLRTACSVAQGLGFAARVPLLPIDSLLAVAEDARSGDEPCSVLATLDARMDEIYAGHYTWAQGRWRTVQAAQLLRAPDIRVPEGGILAGNIANTFAGLLPRDAAGQPPAVQFALPRATAMLRLAPALLAAGHGVAAEHALPHYVRDKVAQTTEERMVARALKDRT